MFCVCSFSMKGNGIMTDRKIICEISAKSVSDRTSAVKLMNESGLLPHVIKTLSGDLGTWFTLSASSMVGEDVLFSNLKKLAKDIEGAKVLDGKDYPQDSCSRHYFSVYDRGL